MEDEIIENLDILLNMDQLENEDIWDEALKTDSLFNTLKD